jgi:hypothetical protein
MPSPASNKTDRIVNRAESNLSTIINIYFDRISIRAISTLFVFKSLLMDFSNDNSFRRKIGEKLHMVLYAPSAVLVELSYNSIIINKRPALSFLRILFNIKYSL